MAEQLSQVENGQVVKDEEEEYQKKNEEGLNKLNNLSQSIGKAFEALQFQSTRQKKNQSNKKISYQMIEDSVIQQETCRSITFNHDGSLMAAACDNNIKIWKFEKGKMEKVIAILQGHTNRVFCIIYSKSRNWIISGGNDTTIRLWKYLENNQWSSPEPGKMHTSFVYCLLMNGMEDQLLSGSDDKSIKVWKVNYEANQLIYDYQLDKHQDRVYQMCLNESETALVSCSKDKQIIVWGKGQNQKWEFKYTINKNIDDFGRRICFINDEMIAWQQHSQGFTHFFKMENGKFIGKTELKIQLKQSKDEGTNLFPIVFNKQFQFLISKHNKYVYIIRYQQNGKFNIECDPIDCYSSNNYGGLSNDGQYLVIWNEFTKQFRVFRFIFQ